LVPVPVRRRATARKAKAAQRICEAPRSFPIGSTRIADSSGSVPLADDSHSCTNE
jgi:hypothetical protein